MNKKTIIIGTVVLVLNYFVVISAFAQDISTVFVDTNITQADATSAVSTTLMEIETALGVAGNTSEEQFETLFLFVYPILRDEEVSRALSQLLPAESLDADGDVYYAQSEAYQPDTFLRLLPALNRLDRASLPEDLIPTLPASLSGISLYSFSSLIRYGACLELMINTIKNAAPKDPQGNPTERCEIPRLGKIRSWSFDPEDKSGSLYVEDMKVDNYSLHYNSTIGIVEFILEEQWSYNWKIEVDKNGYREAIRMTQQEYLDALAIDPDADPFLDVSNMAGGPRPALPVAAKDFFNPNSIWGRGLTGRLFAQGDDITITSVIGNQYTMTAIDELDPSTANVTVYTAIDGKKYIRDEALEQNVVFDDTYAMLSISAESCIDIMFALPENNTFPTTYAEFPPTQRGWCLGRCSSPLIANSR